MTLQCRVCLFKVDTDSSTDLFSQARTGELISEVLTSFAPVCIFKDDGLPDRICLNCEEKLNAVLEFRFLLISSDSKLQQVAASTSCDESFSKGNAKQNTELIEDSIKIEPETIQDKSCISAVKIVFCETCGKSFPGLRYLKKHAIIHDPDKPFKCYDCEKAFKSNGALEQHKKYFHCEKGYKCNSCGEVLDNCPSFKIHMRQHCPDQLQNCQELSELVEDSYDEFIPPSVSSRSESSDCEDPLATRSRPEDNKTEKNKAQNSFDADSETDTSDNKITIAVTKKFGGKRKRDKSHCCLICNKIIRNNMARHFQMVHKDDEDVSKILAMPVKSKARREAFDNLVKCGDFYHNLEVLSMKQGELNLKRRPDAEKCIPYEEYLPCSFCLGFMQKKCLWAHIKKCKVKNSSITEHEMLRRRGHLAEGAALLFNFLGPKVGTKFKEDILFSFRTDSVSDICKNDELIVAVGAFMYEKYGPVQSELVRQAMRQLGRLKLQLETVDKTKKLSEWLAPQNFDVIVNATKAIVGFECDKLKENDFKTPSLALKIGHLLRKCIAIESGSALRNGSEKRHNDLKCFSRLMDLEWPVKISSKALNLLYKKKINCEDKKYAGKELKDIEELPPLILDNEDENQQEEETRYDKAPQLNEEIIASDFEKVPSPKRKNANENRSGVTKKTCPKTPWSMEEKKCILKHFTLYTKSGTLPGKSACEDLIGKYPDVFKNRKWEHLKFFIKNTRDKMKKTCSSL